MTRIASRRAGHCSGWAGSTFRHDAPAVGHSDADVLLHAVPPTPCSARAAPGDIGGLFHNNNNSNKQHQQTTTTTATTTTPTRPTAAATPARCCRRPWPRCKRPAGASRIWDCIVFAELPKLTPYKAAIRQAARQALLGVSRRVHVGLKAKTAEGQDAVGHRGSDRRPVRGSTAAAPPIRQRSETQSKRI